MGVGQGIRVGVVTTSYPRHENDPAGNFVAEHVRWLAARGHEVEVVCAGQGARPHPPWQPGVRITSVPAPEGLFYAGGAPDTLDGILGAGLGSAAARRVMLGAARFSAALAARVACWARRWERVFAHWLVPGAAAAALAPARVPLVAIAHSGDVHLARRLGLTAPLAALLAARGARLCFVSQGLREGFLQAAPGPVRARLERASMVSPMGIDAARWAGLRRRRARHRAHGRGAADVLELLFMGRLVPIKGVDVLLDAVGRLERAGDVAMRVVVAGDGPARPALERRARALATPVHFVGEVRGAGRDAALAAADVLVLPSVPVAAGRCEGTPVTALEAMAAGVPVVASRTGGLAELPASAAALVAPGCARSLAAALERCHRDGQALERQVRAAAAHAASLDWQRVGARLFDSIDDRRG